MNQNEDIIHWTERQAAQDGQFAAVDEHYVRRFCALSTRDVQQMARLLLFDQSKEVLRLAGGLSSEHEVERVTDFLSRMVHFVGLGLMQSDEFGRVRFVSRLGLKPEFEFAEEIESKVDAIRGWITIEVRHVLPLLQSGTLPL